MLLSRVRENVEDRGFFYIYLESKLFYHKAIRFCSPTHTSNNKIARPNTFSLAGVTGTAQYRLACSTHFTFWSLAPCTSRIQSLRELRVLHPNPPSVTDSSDHGLGFFVFQEIRNALVTISRYLFRYRRWNVVECHLGTVLSANN